MAINREYLTKTDCEKLYPKQTVRTNTFLPGSSSAKDAYYGLWNQGCKVKVTKRKSAEQTENA